MPEVNSNNKSKPIYIVGRRHSGTTFLDVSLGSIDNIESLGEIVTGLHNGVTEQMSDGSSLENSPFWNRARELYLVNTGRDLLNDGEVLYRLSTIQNFPSALFSRLENSPRWKDYAERNTALMDALSEAADGARILDSNKEYTRGLLFLKSYKNSKLLHLVRNPVAIAGSHYYRVTEKGIPIGFMQRHFKPGPFLWPILMVTVGLSWTIGIIAICCMKFFYRDRILDISYEKVCTDPEHELRRVGNFLSEDLNSVIQGMESGKAFSAENNVGGNELRYEGSFTFIPNTKGRRHLPWWYKAGIHLVASPGYLLKALFLKFD